MPRLPFTLTLCVALASACYSAGNGTSPPPDIIYYPVGLAVSQGGNVLYVANSDFDLQWNGGTIQSYDLHAIRQDVVAVIANPSNPSANGTIFNGRYVYPAPPPGSCPFNPPLQSTSGNGQRQPVGETCAPAVVSSDYVRDSAIIGAFATDMQLSLSGSRLFVPVRGDASVTWADVGAETGLPSFSPKTNNPYPAFHLDCGIRNLGRCDEAHHAGNDGLEPGNTRNITMPGEPYGMAQSEDGTVIAVTHQGETETSLLSTGLGPGQPTATVNPALQFVLNGGGLPNGGIGIVAIPHDPLAFPDCGDGSDPTQCMPRPAFLETNRTVAEIDLLRYYDDEGYGATTSSLYRPFLVREADFPLTVNAAGTDSRGIAVDKTPRLECEKLSDGSAAALEACARLPARVFVANRTPESLLIGEVGEPTMNGDVAGYDADDSVVYKNIPLTVGPSNVYIAPVVDQNGDYALRVFIVCFDSASIVVYDPNADLVENIIQVGAGPNPMTFDPFDIADVAQGAAVLDDPNVMEPGTGTPIKAYRFAYVGSFTNSYIQVIDLDNSRPDKTTFEKVVFTLGVPTQPVGTQ